LRKETVPLPEIHLDEAAIRPRIVPACGDELLQAPADLGRVAATGVQAANQGADAGTHDQIRPHAQLVEHCEHADVGDPAGGAAAQHHGQPRFGHTDLRNGFRAFRARRPRAPWQASTPLGRLLSATPINIGHPAAQSKRSR